MQIACLVMLAVSTAQVMWWVIDQAQQARTRHDHYLGTFESDVLQAEKMLALGAEPTALEGSFPALEIAEQRVRISPEARSALRDERDGHVNQYVWEGSFFMMVLLGSMSVVWRAVSRESQLRRWQDNFLAAVTHELKSPLASLQLAAETLSMREMSQERQNLLVGRILADAERLGGTVANVLDTHRLDQQALNLEGERLLLAPAVREAVGELEFLARDAGVEVSIDVPSDLAVHVDPAGVRTVLRNLLDNALKAAEKGVGRVAITGEPRGAMGRIVISDNGVGFPPEEADQLFLKFYRVGDEMRRTRTGSGLGLYLTRGFVELEGGRVFATSEGPGKGASFTVEWPMESTW